jgi:hypothetical protein
MEIKQWRTPLIILAVLLGLYLISNMGQSRHSTNVKRVFDIERESVGRFVIVENDTKAEFIWYDSSWTVSAYPADELRKWRIDNFFKNVLGVQRESLVSENPTKFATYGVDEVQGRQVEIYDLDGNLAGHLIVGSSSSNYQSSFIRKMGSDEVYLSTTNIYHQLSVDSTFWIQPPPPPPEPEDATSENES